MRRIGVCLTGGLRRLGMGRGIRGIRAGRGVGSGSGCGSGVVASEEASSWLARHFAMRA